MFLEDPDEAICYLVKTNDDALSVDVVPTLMQRYSVPAPRRLASDARSYVWRHWWGQIHVPPRMRRRPSPLFPPAMRVPPSCVSLRMSKPAGSEQKEMSMAACFELLPILRRLLDSPYEE